MNKVRNKILIIIFTSILLIFFPKVVNAKYLNVSVPSSGAPGSKVNVTISSDCTGRFNISVSNGTINGEKKYWLDGAPATFSVTLGQSGKTTINISPAPPVSLNGNDVYDLSAVSKSISINSTSSSSNSNGSSSSNTSTGKSVKMIVTSPVDFSGFKASNKGPYNVTVENNVSKLTITVKYTDNTTNTYTRNLEEGTNNITIEGYTIRATRKVSETETVPNVGDEQESEDEEKTVEKLRLNNIVLDDELNVKLDPNFDPEIFEYTVLLGNDNLDLEELLISAIANLENANITIEGNTNLIDGENLVTITVEAEGYETVTYTLRVIRGEIIETVAEPEEIVEEEPENNNKTKIIIGIIILAIILIITAIIITYNVKKKNKGNKPRRNKETYDEDYEDNDYDEEYNNPIKDLYNKFNNDEENNIESDIENDLGEDVVGKTEELSETKEEIDKATNFNTEENYDDYEENRIKRKPRRRHGPGKHSK